MANVKSDWTVPELTAPSLSVPKNYAPQLIVPQITPSGKSARQKDVEYKRVKDLGDVLLGGPFGTKQLKNTLKHYDYDYLTYVPLINKIVGAGLMIRERTVEPLMKGDYKTAAINTLESTGRSLDILANPVKSLMPWAGGGSSTDLLKSMGWADNEYREYYQWDTGHWIVDVIGEYISDPLNWAGIVEGATKGSVKASITETEEQITAAVAKATSKEIAEIYVENGVIKNLTRQVVEASADESKQIIEQFIKELESSKDQLLKELSKVKYHSKEWYMLKQLASQYPQSPQQLYTLAQELNAARNTKLYNFYETIRSVKKTSDNIDKAILTMSNIVSPLSGVSGFIIKQIIVPTFKTAYNRFVRSLMEYKLEELTPTQYAGIAKEIAMNNGTIHRPIYSTFQDVFDNYNVTHEDLLNLYVKTYNETPASLRNPNTFNELFTEKLLDRMPRLRKLVSEQDVMNNLDPLIREAQEEALSKGLLLTKEKLEELVQAVSEGGTLLISLNDVASSAKLRVAMQEAEDFWKVHDKIPEGFNRINLAVQEIQTKYPDFQLENLVEFLSQLQYTNEQDFLHYMYIFNYMGITAENAKQVASLLEKLNTSESKEALQQLQDILTRGKTGYAITKKAIDQNKKYMSNLVKRITKEYKIDAFDIDEYNDKLYENIQKNAERSAIVEERPKDLSINTTKQELAVIVDTVKQSSQQIPGYFSLLTYGPGNLLDLIPDNNKELADFMTDYMILYDKLGFEPGYGLDMLLKDDNLREVVELYERIMTDPNRLQYLNEFRNIINKTSYLPFEPETLTQYINKLEQLPDLLTSLNTGETVANVKDLLKTGEDLFIYTTVEHGDLITVTSNLAQSEIDSETWEAISDMKSPLRANLRRATSNLESGIVPNVSYIVVPNLHRAGGEPVLASVDANNRILIKQGITKKEFFDYIQGTGLRSATSQQKRAVFQSIIHDTKNPITLDKMKSLITSEQDINYFLYQHELSHIKHKDATNYILGKENLMNETNLKIEKRATMDAFKALEAQRQRINTAYYVDMMLSTIDGTNNINRLLGNLNVLAIADDKEMYNYLQGLMYNEVYKYRDQIATSLLNETTFNNIIDEFMEQAERDNKAYFAVHPELLDRLRNSFENAFSDYVKTQVYIGMYNNTNIKLLQTWNYAWFNDTFGELRNAAQIFDDLGLSYKPILEYLMNTNADAQVVLDTSKAIQFLTDNTAADDLKNTARRIRQYAKRGVSNKEFNAMIDKELQRTYTVSLSKAIEETEVELSKVNKQLTQAQAISGKYWSEQGEERAKNAIALMLASETDKFTQLSNRYQNRYNHSTANQFLGYKKVYSQKFMTTNHITPDDLPNVTNKGYNLFYHKMESAAKVIEGRSFEDIDEINVIRNSLINLFMDNPTLEFAPKDPLTYFSNLTPEQLKMWDITVTDNNLGIVGANRYKEVRRAFTENRNYTYAQKVRYRTTPESMYMSMRDAIQRQGVTDAAIMYKQMSRKLGPYESFGNRGIHDLITEDFSTYIKNPEDLGKYKGDIDNYIQENITDYNKLKSLDYFTETEKDISVVAALRGEIEKNNPIGLNEDKKMYRARINDLVDSELKRLEPWGIKGSDHMTSGEVRMLHSQQRNYALNQSYHSWNAFQLRDYLDRETQGLGFVVYKTPDFLDARVPDLAHKFTDEQLKEAGIEIIPLKHNDEYFIHRTSNEILGKARHTWLKPTYIFEDEQEVLTNTIADIRKYLRNTGIPDDLYLGTSITISDFENILGHEELAELTKDLDLSEILKDKRPIPNTIFIGDLNCYNDFFYNTDMTIADSNIIATPMTNVMDKELWTTATLSIDADNTEKKLLQTIFNKDFDANNALFHTALDGATDEELQQIFKRNNWVATVVREDKNGAPKIYRYYVTSQKTLNEARQLGAAIIPYNSYRTMVLAINKHAIENKALRNYLAICAMYKSVYLTTPGFLMRNEWDSNYMKNLTSSQGMEAFMDNIKYRYKARKLNEWYEESQKQIAKMAYDDIGVSSINKYYTKKFMETLSEEDQKLYIMLDMFNKTPASAGLSQTMQQILFEYNDAHGVINRTAMEEWLNKSLYEHGPIKWVNSINDSIERDARLSLFLNLTDNGLAPEDAIRKIIDTHFDYELSAFQLKPVEQLMWFSVFPFNNLAYYLGEGTTKNIDVLKLQLDMLEQSWNSGEYSWEDVRNNDYYFYNVMAGNVRFMLGDKDILLKLGSSVMDFFQLLVNPTGALKDRLNPFLSVLLGLDDVSGLNPVVANISRAKQIREGRSYVPSVYTKLMHYDNRKRKYLSRYAGGSGPVWTTYPKKVARPSNQAKHMFRATTYRYYFSRGKNLHRWLSSTTAIEPHWYHNNYRYRRFQRKYLTKGVQLKHLR